MKDNGHKGAVALKERVATVRTMLEQSKSQIAMALPRHLTPERMLRVAMTAIQRTPRLLECDPRTLVARVVEASQLGLEPDGILGYAYLVPFRNNKAGTTDCQLIPGYKGLLMLARRSGDVSTLFARVVHQKDRYEIRYGIEPKLEHTPIDADDPGPIVAVYAVCRLKDGGVQYEWMWKREVDAIRRRSKSADDGPWVTDYEEMAKKTVLRRLAKVLPLTPEAQRAVASDELFESPTRAGAVPLVDAVGAIPEAITDERPNGLDALAERLSGETEAVPAQLAAAPSPDTGKAPPQPAAAAVPEGTADYLNDLRDYFATQVETVSEVAPAVSRAELRPDLKDHMPQIRAWARAAEDRIRGRRGERSNSLLPEAGGRPAAEH